MSKLEFLLFTSYFTIFYRPCVIASPPGRHVVFQSKVQPPFGGFTYPAQGNYRGSFFDHFWTKTPPIITLKKSKFPLYFILQNFNVKWQNPPIITLKPHSMFRYCKRLKFVKNNFLHFLFCHWILFRHLCSLNYAFCFISYFFSCLVL